MQDQILGLIIVVQVALMFSAHPLNRMEMLTFKGHNKDQGIVQISVIHQEGQIHVNPMIENLGTQVLVFLQENQIFLNPLEIDLASKDHPANPAVQIHGVRENQTIVAEEDIDLLRISPFIN
jgi:hypothetical protein